MAIDNGSGACAKFSMTEFSASVVPLATPLTDN